ncbi:PREDICTED: uncharacterized protein LOC105566318 isoform X2 [Vollenhovia emeryi]|uniref:uncharacterized protein LOC105566318 isoform X2 n=1 Tax=Vollenhovia emeryi TaxID=411798 RepID=UPI0005F55714|nr:PREDICTED: uncharacterized protein LOC105566318 isoform X2 [Vollenhovia emeryi]
MKKLISLQLENSDQVAPSTMMKFMQQLLLLRLANHESCSSWFSQFFTSALELLR